MAAIGQLAGGVAHDFNNLLTPIVGSLDLVRRRHKEDERTQRMIGRALQAAERGPTLTQRLLAFVPRQALQPQAVDVGALIDGIVDLVHRSLGPTVTVVLEVSRHLPSARVDPNQLELALLNLAINAGDAMPGGGQLTIAASAVAFDGRTTVGLAAGSYIRILAVDTGVGIRGGADVNLLITDYLMPAMTGAAPITELRGSGRPLPALLITGYAAAGEDVPADVPRLAKPFRQVDLPARVDDLLMRPPGGKPALRAVT